jgi:hypothetical protein
MLAEFDLASLSGGIKELGFPIVVAVAVGWASWQVVIWVGKAIRYVSDTFLVPLRNQLMGFLSSLARNVDRISENLEAQTASFRSVIEQQNRMEEKQNRMEGKIDDIISYGCGACRAAERRKLESPE